MNNELNSIISYCEALAFNNNRQWFHENHKQYEAAKDTFEELIDIIKFKLLTDIPEVGEPIFTVSPSAMSYRIPRDARVLGSKPPYLPSFRAYFAPDRHSWQPDSYYIKIGHDEVFTGTALFLQNTSEINLARQYFADNMSEFHKAIPATPEEFPITGDMLKKMPSPFPSDHPLGEILRMKNWRINYSFDVDAFTTLEAFADECVSKYKQMEPMRKFFNSTYDHVVSKR